MSLIFLIEGSGRREVFLATLATVVEVVRRCPVPRARLLVRLQPLSSALSGAAHQGGSAR